MAVVVIVHAALSALILAFHLAVAAGCLLNILRDRRAGLSGRSGGGTELMAANVEVVVALRNEIASLPGLLAALRAQDCPGCGFLFVDDRSTDGTGRLLDEFCATERG